MRKIVFNGMVLASEKTAGISRFTIELLKAMDQYVQPGECEILAPECSFDSDIFHNIKLKKIGRQGKWNSKIWKNVIFPVYCIFSKAFTVNTAITWRYFTFNAISIHDCIPDFYPESCYPQNVKQVIHNQAKQCLKSDFIITVSSTSKHDISKVYQIPEEKIVVIPNGWQHFNEIQEDDGILESLSISNNQYYFSLGSRRPYKNIKWITAAAKKHPEQVFVVTGSREGRKDTSFEGDIPENMIFTGYLKDEEIKALMRHCRAFIHPSFYEGFGIPPLEAMSVGADCIVSNAGSLPEVYKNSVWYINPYDYENINLDEIMSRPKESNELILNEYSWEKSARKLLDILRKWA